MSSLVKSESPYHAANYQQLFVLAARAVSEFLLFAKCLAAR
jgi:hypothetical protein